MPVIAAILDGSIPLLAENISASIIAFFVSSSLTKLSS
jgi:hypothetical protein